MKNYGNFNILFEIDAKFVGSSLLYPFLGSACVSYWHQKHRTSMSVSMGDKSTHSVLPNEALVPRGCMHSACRTRPSFHELYFCCHGKHSQTETGFKMNFLPVKGENFTTFYCIVLTFRLAKIQWLAKEIFVFLSVGYVLFMDDDSRRKVDYLDDGWVLGSE